MNARTPVAWGFSLGIILTACSLGQIGCNKADTESDGSGTAYAASGGIPPAAASGPGDASAGQDSREAIESRQENLAATQAPSPSESLLTGTQGIGSDRDQAAPRSEGDNTQTRQAGPPSDAPGSVSTPFEVAGANTAEAANTPQHELRADLSAEQLLEFLAIADQDIQMIVSRRSGITDPQKARGALVHIVKMKLEASRRLSKDADASESARSEGKRGELQSMSHLAALGDLKIANELEKLAEENLESSDAALVADSRLVLIGFAIESLQNGEKDAADQVVRYVSQIAGAESKPDVPAMMVMGQARQVLASYGHDDQARRVRDWIIDLFADSPDPEIAQMAAQLAGNVRFDAIEELRAVVMDGEPVAASRWREAAQTLIRESADLQTVQYLAGAALEFESLGLIELSDATYEVMSARFDDPESATGREVQLALAAGQARKDVIGTIFDPKLSQTDGSPLSMADFKSRVVLVPFWATGFPESLQLIPRLKSIQELHGDDVSIVGINLDAAGAAVDEFRDLGFPSFRAESSATAEVANVVAAKFGMVSMPFTAIVDQEGRVAAINFTGRDLEKTVEELLRR